MVVSRTRGVKEKRGMIVRGTQVVEIQLAPHRR